MLTKKEKAAAKKATYFGDEWGEAAGIAKHL